MNTLVETEFVTPIPAVNLFVNSSCNMHCRFCFGTCSFPETIQPEDRRRRQFALLDECAKAYVRKVTFVGGEPLLCPWLDEAIARAHDLGMTTCVVTNGARVTRQWLGRVSSSLDWIGYSIDSVIMKTNEVSGRSVAGRALSRARYRDMVMWAHGANVKLKINTTVTRWNVNEDMSEFLCWAQPRRVKMFQAATVEGINSDFSDAFTVTDGEFEAYIARHKGRGVNVVAESARSMQGSYLMISPDGCFFENRGGQYLTGRPIHEVGYQAALSDIRWDANLFHERGGLYDW